MIDFNLIEINKIAKPKEPQIERHKSLDLTNTPNKKRDLKRRFSVAGMFKPDPQRGNKTEI